MSHEVGGEAMFGFMSTCKGASVQQPHCLLSGIHDALGAADDMEGVIIDLLPVISAQRRAVVGPSYVPNTHCSSNLPSLLKPPPPLPHPC